MLIDDSRTFLDSLAFQLNPQIVYKVFHDSRSAMDWLRAQPYSAMSDPIYARSDEQANFFEWHSTHVDLSRIYHISLNRQRFDMPSVLIIDYAMPQMNGLELCEAVRGLPCKKILLTGQADEKLAVDAFNRKLIDRFIKKNDPDALNRLEGEIIQLQKDFFNE
ncbi:MAG TPA: response regulator, partial [Burkholderiales bacterium]|nr:response regulator [Burkholderiales bacterium]